jgi:hypothetical protein
MYRGRHHRHDENAHRDTEDREPCANLVGPDRVQRDHDALEHVRQSHAKIHRYSWRIA